MALPIWKWAALIEGWAWAHCAEDKHDELESILSAPIEWYWHRSRVPRRRDPASWQTNTPGEVLLKGKKRRDTNGGD